MLWPVSIYQSITSRYCIKMVKHMIMQGMLHRQHNSPGTLVSEAKDLREIRMEQFQ